jgi:cobalt/nickel transport system permease protein
VLLFLEIILLGRIIMHMADALLSPAVGGTMWAASAGAIAYCSAKVRKEMDTSKVPLMGVLGAFIFAAQMINFTIPATGSSGHLGGGLILTILLGPYAAFLTIASVLVVQALFFADGGLLALGCNIFNLGLVPAFIAYPFIYKPLTGKNLTQAKIATASMIAAIAGLQMGAFGVVMETVASGISSLPFPTFVALMQPIHLGIGIVEGLVTASVVSFVYKARPEVLLGARPEIAPAGMPMINVLFAFLSIAMLAGGIVSWFASENPDGLEWSIAKVTGKGEIEAEKVGVHGVLAGIQGKMAFLPDYNFKKPEAARNEKSKPVDSAAVNAVAESKDGKKEEESRLGTSVAGLIGGLMTLGLAFIIGFLLKKKS